MPRRPYPHLDQMALVLVAGEHHAIHICVVVPPGPLTQSCAERCPTVSRLHVLPQMDTCKLDRMSSRALLDLAVPMLLHPPIRTSTYLNLHVPTSTNLATNCPHAAELATFSARGHITTPRNELLHLESTPLPNMGTSHSKYGLLSLLIWAPPTHAPRTL